MTPTPFSRFLGALTLFAGLAVAPPAALAQDLDDDLADILGEEPEPSEERTDVGREREQVERDAAQDDASIAEARGREQVSLPPPRKKLIKTLQRKYFLKMGRGEVTPYVGIVTNDPFLRRILFGASLGYHLNELLEIELNGGYSPTFGVDGRGDYKVVTGQITDQNAVAPELSRLTGHATLNLNFSPLYGKVATRGRGAIIFDIYGLFGMGFAYTVDDLVVTNSEGQAFAEATRNQFHPAISFGGGLRVAFTKSFAVRFEARSLSYIGTFESTSLELKNNLALMLGGSIFFGRKPQ